jgi:catalase
MATRKTPAGASRPTSRQRATASKAAARSTATNPSAPGDAGGTDALAARDAAVDTWVAGMPANANKPLEYGREHAVSPPRGVVVEPPSRDASAGTLSERNLSAKVAAAPTEPGADPLSGPLDRVRVDAAGQVLTTDQGVPIGDNQHSLKAGLRGPTLLEDFILREKITHFDHERIPERIVHARGSAAHGYFECTRPMTRYTRAAPLQEAGKRTPVFVRFSTVAGERGSTDTARDVRGFAVKFYTDEGNWDLVGNNIPVFFIQDAMKFPDLVHAVKPEPHHGMPQAASAHDTFWDFVSLMPESTHMLTWVMSDRGIPRSFRMMEGFGVHTFRLVNAEGRSVFCKFHWKPRLGTHSLVWDEAVRISGADPDFHRRDLWEAIEAGEYPEWDLGLQIFDEQTADGFSFDVLDATKLIPEELVPVTLVGTLVLNRNPDNFFAETEQVAFCTAHVIPGIDFSNDPLLAGRIHSYIDTQITRLGGPNFHEIPVNAPVVPVHNNQRDGLHRQAIHRGRVAYEPNSLAGGCPFQAGARGFVSFPAPVAEDKVRGKPGKFADHYTQARLFYDSQTPIEQRHMEAAFRFELSKLTVPAIRSRMLSSLVNVSPKLAGAVAQALGLEVPRAMPRAMPQDVVPEVTRSAVLSLTARPGDGGIRTRRVAMLVAPGAVSASLETVRSALVDAGAVALLVGARLGACKATDGATLDVDATLENAPSVVFDAVVLPDGNEAAAGLIASAQAQEFVKLAYRHGKTLMAIGAGQEVLSALRIDATLPDGRADPGVIVSDAKGVGRGTEDFIDAIARHRHTDRDTDPPRV